MSPADATQPVRRASVLAGWNKGRNFALALACLGTCATGCSDTAVERVANKPVSSVAVDAELPKPDALRDELDDVLRFTLDRHLSNQEHAAWQIVHGVLAYGHDLKIKADGEVVPALDYMMKGGSVRGWTLRPGDRGVDSVVAGDKAGQGHEDQWLGYLSQVGLTPDDPLVVAGKTYKVADLMTQAQWDIYDGMEATWTLMAASRYLPLDAQWTARDGSNWTIDRIVEMETGQDLAQSACGGTHRMYGLATAIERYLSEGKPLAGPWKAADDKIQDCISKAREFQQPDGSLSTAFFERAANSPDVAVRMHTAGHTLEFLVLAMNEKQIREPWVTRAVVKLCDLFKQTRDLPIECGALYHAAHGLYLYRLRMFGPIEFSASGTPSEGAQPATDAAADASLTTSDAPAAAADKPAAEVQATEPAASEGPSLGAPASESP